MSYLTQMIHYTLQKTLQSRAYDEEDFSPIDLRYKELFLECLLEYIGDGNFIKNEKLKIFSFQPTYHIKLIVKNIYYLEANKKIIYYQPFLLGDILFEKKISPIMYKKFISSCFISLNHSIKDINESFLAIEDKNFNFLTYEMIHHLDNSIPPKKNLIEEIINLKFHQWLIKRYISEDVKNKTIVLEALSIHPLFLNK